LTRGVAVYETWGQQLNNLIFVCNCPRVIAIKNLIEQNKEIPKALKKYISVINFPILNLEINENKEQMGEKVLKVLVQSYEIYKNHSNFYYMVDDDAYVFVNNLHKYIQSLNETEPKIYGFKYNHLPLPSGHIHGGSGILFSKESMQRLVSKIKKNQCDIHIDKHGDVTIGGCAHSAQIQLIDSRDKNGKPRFHTFDPYIHFYGPIPSFLYIYGSHNKKIGKDCCSPETIAFHYVKVKLMYEIYRNHDFLKNLLL
jgi:glycoprotein-N-acetylgalactosamine 3-beta-galactosyltransferase